MNINDTEFVSSLRFRCQQLNTELPSLHVKMYIYARMQCTQQSTSFSRCNQITRVNFTRVFCFNFVWIWVRAHVCVCVLLMDSTHGSLYYLFFLPHTLSMLVCAFAISGNNTWGMKGIFMLILKCIVFLGSIICVCIVRMQKKRNCVFACF